MPFRFRLVSLFFGVLCLLTTALSALAQDEDKIPDARVEGYTRNVKVEGGGTATWILFIVLTVLCMSVLFKNAKRTHLD